MGPKNPLINGAKFDPINRRNIKGVVTGGEISPRNKLELLLPKNEVLNSPGD